MCRGEGSLKQREKGVVEMNYLLYDKHGMVIDALNIEPKIDKFQLAQAMKDYIRIAQVETAGELDVEGFQLYLYARFDVDSIGINFDRLNVGV